MSIRTYLEIAALAALLAALWWFGAHERSIEHAKDVAAAQRAVQKQIEANAADAARREAANKETVDALQKQLALVPVGADDIARRLCQLPRSRPVPEASGSPKGTDGAPAVSGGGETPIATDFVEACRSDAARLSAWQAWAVKQGLPVE